MRMKIFSFALIKAVGYLSSFPFPAFAEPLNYDVITSVSSYTDSTGPTTHAIECYNPTICVGNNCPLYIWLDGTSHNAILDIPDRRFLAEMVDRGFVSCVALYDDGATGYLNGCSSFRTKARDIFDPTRVGSVTNQICGTFADCSLGVATHGWSQGAHIAALASDYIDVTASLLFGNGNKNTFTALLTFTTDVPCVNDNELTNLSKARRRSIIGEYDSYFDDPPVLQQQKETSGYDCGIENNCLGRLPETCSYGSGENQCTSSGQYFHAGCAECPVGSTGSCDSNTGLEFHACPESGGYFIVPGQDHGFFLLVDDGANSSFEPAFLDNTNIWGMTQGFDWLARTANVSTTTVTESPSLSHAPTPAPSSSPSNRPSLRPSSGPTQSPVTEAPSLSNAPTPAPSPSPSNRPSLRPSSGPTQNSVSPTGSGTCSNSGAACSTNAECSCPSLRRRAMITRALQCSNPQVCSNKNPCCVGFTCVKKSKACEPDGTPSPSDTQTLTPSVSPSASFLPSQQPSDAPTPAETEPPAPFCGCVLPTDAPSSKPSGTPSNVPTNSPTVGEVCTNLGLFCDAPGQCCSGLSCKLNGNGPNKNTCI